MSNAIRWYRHFGKTLRKFDSPYFFAGYIEAILKDYFVEFDGITRDRAETLARLFVDKVFLKRSC